MATFELVKERIKTVDLEYDSFGILSKVSDGEQCFISDVTTDESKARALVRVLRANEVSPLHLYDVITDWLADEF